MSSKPRRGAAALPAVLRYWPPSPHAAALALVQRGPLPSPSLLTTHQPPSWLRRCCRHGTMSTPSPVCRCLEWRYSSTVSSTSIHDDSSFSLTHNKLGRQREALLLHIVHSLDMGQARKKDRSEGRQPSASITTIIVVTTIPTFHSKEEEAACRSFFVQRRETKSTKGENKLGERRKRNGAARLRLVL